MMYTIYKKFRDFLIEKMNAKLAELDSESVVTLTEDCVHFGAVDVSKLATKVSIAILPESQLEIEDDIADFCENSEFTVSFLFQKNAYETLLEQMCIYASALRSVIIENPSMDGTVDEIEIGERKFYCDCGTTEKTMTAFESTVTIKDAKIFD